jgi:hypothetical protein
MTKEELREQAREKMARELALANRYVHDFDAGVPSVREKYLHEADQILDLSELASYFEALLRERGYQSHEEVQDIVDAIAELQKIRGYVQLDLDQSLPNLPSELAGWEVHTRYYRQAQQDMLKQGWRKIVEH